MRWTFWWAPNCFPLFQSKKDLTTLYKSSYLLTWMSWNVKEKQVELTVKCSICSILQASCMFSHIHPHNEAWKAIIFHSSRTRRWSSIWPHYLTSRLHTTVSVCEYVLMVDHQRSWTTSVYAQPSPKTSLASHWNNLYKTFIWNGRRNSFTVFASLKSEIHDKETTTKGEEVGANGWTVRLRRAFLHEWMKQFGSAMKYVKTQKQ